MWQNNRTFIRMAAHNSRSCDQDSISLYQSPRKLTFTSQLSSGHVLNCYDRGFTAVKIRLYNAYGSLESCIENQIIELFPTIPWPSISLSYIFCGHGTAVLKN